MTTTVSDGKVQPAVNLNKIHWASWIFKQPLPDTTKSIEGAFYYYGYPEGSTEREYDEERVPVNLPNADQVIIGNHIAEGGTIESFMAALQSSKVSGKALIDGCPNFLRRSLEKSDWRKRPCWR